MNDELKPCPFCASKAKLYESCSEELPYGVGCTNKECHIYSGYGMKLYDTKYKAITSWNKRKRARAKFDDGEGDTCTISVYDGLLYCSCGRALKMCWNIDSIQDKCQDCGRKIEVPENKSEIPVIETKCLDTIGYKVTANGRVLSGIKFLKPAMGRSGYPVVTMTIDGKQTKQVIKYLVAKTFLEKPESEDVEYVINLNGNVWDNRVENLRWVNALEYDRITNAMETEYLAQKHEQYDELMSMI